MLCTMVKVYKVWVRMSCDHDRPLDILVFYLDQ